MKAKLYHLIQYTFLLALLLILNACAMPTYQKTIDEFAVATSEAKAAFGAYMDNAAQIDMDRRVLRLSKTPKDVSISKNHASNCLQGSKDCYLEEKKPLEGDNPPIVLKQYAPKGRILLAQIATYADGLSKIVHSDTAASVSESLTATRESIDSISKTISGGKPTAFSPFTKPVFTLIDWLVGNYIASLQWKALKTATKDCETPIREAANILKKEMEEAQGIATSATYPILSNAASRFRTSNPNNQNNQELLKQAIKLAAIQDAFLKNNPGDALDKMGKAHDEIIRVISAKKLSDEEVFAAIRQFTDEVKKLQEIVTMFRTED